VKAVTANGVVTRTIDVGSAPISSIYYSSSTQDLLIGRVNALAVVMSLRFGNVSTFNASSANWTMTSGAVWMIGDSAFVGGYLNGGIEQWQAGTRTFVRLLFGHTAPVTSFADTRGELYSGSMDGTIIRWNIGTGRQIEMFTVTNSCPFRSIAIYGTDILATNDDGTVILFSITAITTPLPKAPPMTRSFTVTQLARTIYPATTLPAKPQLIVASESRGSFLDIMIACTVIAMLFAVSLLTYMLVKPLPRPSPAGSPPRNQ
jgi:hypothetical protein